MARLRLMMVAVLLAAVPACKQKPKEPPQPEQTWHVTPEINSASEAIGKQIPTNTPGMPGRSGVQAIQKALQANEAHEGRYERRAAEAAQSP